MKRSFLIGYGCLYSFVLLFGGLLLPAEGAARSGKDLPGGVRPDARWILHFDVERVKQGAMFQALAKSEAGAPDMRFEKFKELTKIDPTTDLDSFTVFGNSGDPDDAVVRIKGRFDADTLIAKAAEQEAYRTLEEGGRVFHSWSAKTGADAETLFGFLDPDGALLISRGLESLKAAVDPSGSLPAETSGASSTYPSLRELLGDVSAPLVIAFSGLERDAGAQSPQAAMMSQADAGRFTLSEDAEALRGRLDLFARDEAAAMQLYTAVQGLLMLGRMKAAEEMPQLRPLLDAARVTITGRQMTFETSYSLREAIRQIQARIKGGVSGL